MNHKSRLLYSWSVALYHSEGATAKKSAKSESNIVKTQKKFNKTRLTDNYKKSFQQIKIELNTFFNVNKHFPTFYPIFILFRLHFRKRRIYEEQIEFFLFGNLKFQKSWFWIQKVQEC